MNIPNQIADFVKNEIADVPLIGGAMSAFGSLFGGDDEDEPSERGADGTDKRLKASESPAPAPRTPKKKSGMDRWKERQKGKPKTPRRDVGGWGDFGIEPGHPEYRGDEQLSEGQKFLAEQRRLAGGGFDTVDESLISKKKPLYMDKKFKDMTPEERKERKRQSKIQRVKRKIGKFEESKSGLERTQSMMERDLASGEVTDPGQKRWLEEQLEQKPGQIENYENLIGDQQKILAKLIQESGLEKGAAGAAPVVINSSPQTNVSNSNHPTSAVLAGSRDLSSDPSLNVNP